MGTSIQRLPLSMDDFWGKEGCNELLVLSKPDAIKSIHSDFLAAGCDVIETDTFGGTRIVLGDYELSDKVYEINLEAAKLARAVANDFSTPAHPRYVAGSMGPGTKLPSLGHISYSQIYQAYREQAAGLIDGRVDVILVETVQDPLQAKAALNAVFHTLQEKRVNIPVMASVTMETTGSMLLGTDMLGALTILEPYPLEVIGLNCGTGPKDMNEHLHTLSAHSPFPISVIPNAGLPHNINGEMVYDLSASDLAHDLGHYIDDLGVNIVGGCCGTTAEHMKAVVERAGRMNPVQRTPVFTAGASSLYAVSSFKQEPRPLIIGERTNANGSKLFRDMLLSGDQDGMIKLAREQVEEGAHILDVCVAYVGRDEAADMAEYIEHINSQITIPLMIDSTEIKAIRAALERITGRAIVNSINLEDGETKAIEVIKLCREFGAALVCLTIDENGMAKIAEHKLAVAKRIYDLAVVRYGMRESDLFFDPLTFTLASGDEEFRKSAKETLDAIGLIKKAYPAASTSLGLSNVSFGLKPATRFVLNSVFLHMAVEAGLDAAILHAGKIQPYYQIKDKDRQLCEDLILDNRRADYDPLVELLESHTDRLSQSNAKVDYTSLPVKERLHKRIVEGNRSGLASDLDEALQESPALKIINNVLLGGMKEVGELFGAGKLQLPFVLQSAETMKAAVQYLEPFMERSEVSAKAKIILATVKGDVHDIGKNLVDIILTNNGFQVVNLGIKVSIDQMVQAFKDEKADAIGMSGLLVKSTIVMKENLEILNDHGIKPPIILGGAALTRSYVDKDLRGIYPGLLSYARDAFDGLHFMQNLEAGTLANTVETIEKPSKKPTMPKEIKSSIALSPVLKIPEPPFWGRKVVDTLDLDVVFPYINQAALFRGHWGFKKGKVDPGQYAQIEQETIFPTFENLKKLAKQSQLLNPKILYGYYACQSEGDRLWIYEQPGDATPVHYIDFPRQQGEPGRAIPDYFRPISSGEKDVLAFQLVTVGARATEYAQELYAKNNYTDYLYFHGFAVETAEALAEYWHKIIREELHIHEADGQLPKELFRQKYQGSRFSFGYPACPELKDQELIFKLLDARSEGLELTEEYQIVPEQSTSAIIVHHPEAKYFSV
ncbi:MAG: methionine synthase [Candidatus Marinimicrobia bacterium]|nr:methionine synthase [Candidatus Neomarinimicrobiota bacterium]